MTTTKADLSILLELPEEQTERMLQGCEISIDLEDYSEHLETLECVKASMIAQPDKAKSWSQAYATYKEQTALTPSAAASISSLSFGNIPLDGSLAQEWEKAADEEAELLRDRIAGAPFDGIAKAGKMLTSPEQIAAGEQHGQNLVYAKVNEKLNDPDYAKGLAARKRQERRQG